MLDIGNSKNKTYITEEVIEMCKTNPPPATELLEGTIIPMYDGDLEGVTVYNGKEWLTHWLTIESDKVNE